MTKLFVGAHPDDVELGCGGTIARNGFYSSAAIFTLCGTNSGLSFLDIEIKKELYDSMKVLGVENRIYIQNYENTRLYQHAEAIRHDLENIKKDLKPDEVYIPSLNSIHQDHLVVAMEAIRAFRGRETIYSYEVLSEKIFVPNVFMDITNTIDRKVEAIQCYKTQGIRPYMDEEIWRGLARVYGVKSGVRYAEAFELIRKFV